MIPPVGGLHRLDNSAGLGSSAVISRRAAALRLLRVGGVDIVEPTVRSDPPPGLAGATLVPWPNRVEGARWDLDGREQRLEVTEPEFGHANHGLLLDVDYDVVSATGRQVVLHAVVADRPGYPFTLDVLVSYELEETGIAVSYRVRNLSAADAPFALGAHPYPRMGAEPVAGLTLSIAASRALDLDATHIPRAEFAVAGTPWDLREGVGIARVVRNAAYGGLSREGSDIVHRLTAPDGRCVELRAHPKFGWVQVYVAADFESDDGPRTSIAIEPMTAPPNALRTGVGVTWLETGRDWEAGWSLRLVAAPA